MMEFFDTHFHLPEKGSCDDFLKAAAADVKASSEISGFDPDAVKMLLLAAGADFEESCRSREFADNYADGYFSCGVHPHCAEKYAAERDDFSIFRNAERLVAIGEIGLDYFYEDSPRAVQNEVFAEFLELALKWDLPAMLHLRDKGDEVSAYCDALRQLESFVGKGGRFVIHCCTVPQKMLDGFLALGAMIGVTGMVTFRGAADVREMLSRVPDERLLIETDSPYLAPIPFRGRSNTPGLVPLAAERLALERGMTLAEMAALTTANGKRFYAV